MKFLRKLTALFAILALAGSVAAIQAFLNLRESAALARGPDPDAYEFIRQLLFFEVLVVFLTISFNFGYFIIRKIVGYEDAEAFRLGSMEYLLLQQTVGAIFIVVVRSYLVFGEKHFSVGAVSALAIAGYGFYRVMKSKIKESYKKPKMSLTRH
jgi:hypothetical protein